MVFGLGTKKKETKKIRVKKTRKQSVKSKLTNSSSQADEAAEFLKKMDDKKASGECPFC